MLRKLFLIASIMAGLMAGEVWAANPAERLVNHCGYASDERLCETHKAKFLKDYQSAMKGSYQGQRNVAFCRRDTCDGAVQVDVIDGCAWRMIIMASDAVIDSGDVANYRMECSRIGNTGMMDAYTAAKRLYRKIYKRPMPEIDPPM